MTSVIVDIEQNQEVDLNDQTPELPVSTSPSTDTGVDNAASEGPKVTMLWSDSKEADWARSQIKRLRMRMKYSFTTLLVVLAVSIGVACGAMSRSAEISTESHNLIDSDGRVVATSQHRDKITGVSVARERRLTDLSFADTGSYRIDVSFYDQCKEQYSSGKADWIVELADGGVRTVQVLGTDEVGAWGKCGGCTEDVRWRVLCSVNETDCTITTHTANDEAMQRRLDTVPNANMTLPELAMNVPNATRKEVVAFLEEQQLASVAELAATNVADLSQAFPKVSKEFTLGHRAAVRMMITMAQQASYFAESSGFLKQKLAERAILSHRTGMERMLGGKECF